MRLATATLPDGTTSAIVEIDGRWRRLPYSDLSAALGSLYWRDAPAQAGAIVESPIFGNPLPLPGKVICCGQNYVDHIREMGRTPPKYPTLFTKFADTLCGPDDDIVIHESESSVDWEAELAVVIGSTLSRANESDAAAAIAGYTIANDISLRDWQNRTTEWLQGKAFDRTTPVGPIIVSADAVDPAAGLEISCHVNGELRQRGNTAGLVFSASTLVSYISSFVTLRAGDLVLTGTPSGVGAGMTPPRFLKDGDIVTTTIESIGSLNNRVRIHTASDPVSTQEGRP